MNKTFIKIYSVLFWLEFSIITYRYRLGTSDNYFNGIIKASSRLKASRYKGRVYRSYSLARPLRINGKKKKLSSN